LVPTFKKLLIAITLVYGSNSLLLRLIIIIIIFSIYISFELIELPYKLSPHNIFDFLTAFTIYVTALCGVLFFFNNKRDTYNVVNSNALDIAVVCINALLLVSVLYAICHNYARRIRTRLSSLILTTKPISTSQEIQVEEIPTEKQND